MSPPSPRLVLLAVGALGVSAVMTQLALMRELLGVFAGNEMVLGIVLGSWLLLSGLGAWLGKSARKLRRPGPLFVLLLLGVAVLPLAEVLAARLLRPLVFLRGAMVGVPETVAATLAVLAPFCVVSGYLLTLGSQMVGGETGIGRVYVADGVGSVIGGALFTFVLVRWFDHFALLALPALLSLAVAAALAWRSRLRLLCGAAVVAGLALIGVLALADIDAQSARWAVPGQRIAFRGSSPYGKLLVTETAGQFNFLENGLPVIATHQVEPVEEAAHYALAQRPAARGVLLVGGGVAGTAREILKYPAATVTYVELDPLILAAGRRFLPDNLADDRIRVVNTDGRLFIKLTEERFDVIIVDLPDPSTSQLNRFYTAEFFAEVKRVLAPGGVLSFALGRYENYVSPELGRVLAAAHRTTRESFHNLRMIPGGRVYFLASDGELFDDIAGRIEQAGVTTRLVNRHYLAATLTPDRRADLERAVAQPAGVNRDFAPVLYLYHLRYWLSQFGARFGALTTLGAGLVTLGLVVYLSRLRAVSFAIFAGGFAASALEVVLLLGVQILYGSVYQQLGVIVTGFMAGLAAGAWTANRRRLAARHARSMASRAALGWLAGGVALFAAVLPLALARLGSAPLFAVPALVAVLTFPLAFGIGLEFPVATAVETEADAGVAARLYTADFVGASLGALLASTLLIPVLGVTATCWLTAAVNAASGAWLIGRKV